MSKAIYFSVEKIRPDTRPYRQQTMELVATFPVVVEVDHPGGLDKEKAREIIENNSDVGTIISLQEYKNLLDKFDETFLETEATETDEWNEEEFDEDDFELGEKESLDDEWDENEEDEFDFGE